MNLRKVQEIGGTYLLSIPIDWARRSGLTKGSIVEIIEREDGCILVDPQYGLEKNVETTIIHPSNFL